MLFGDKNILLWLLFLALFALCAFWQLRENRQLALQLRESVDGPLAQWLMRLAWSRTWQLLVVLGCSMVIIAVCDWQLSDTRTALKAAEEMASASPPSTHTLPPELPTLKPETVTATSPTGEDVLSTLKAQLQEAQKPLAPPPSDTIDDVYNPEKNSKDNQSVMDGIKKRYEDILVNYIFLEKCGKTTANDYRIIMSALGQEMASVNAPGRLQYDILTAAQGSYKEMYAESRCEGDGYNALYAQYTDYIKTLSEHFPAQ